MPRRSMLAAAAFLAAGGALACDPPPVRFTAPATEASGASGLTVHVTLEDTSLAEQLGWGAGVPGAIVALNRVREDFQPDTLVTDSGGRVVFRDVASGPYRIWAERLLDANEAVATGGRVRGFGHGVRMELGGGETLSFALRGDQPGSVVFSEFHVSGQTDLAPGYVLAKYVEVYNNSDTTVYLDGMLVGWAWAWHTDSDRLGCAGSEPFRNDPEGLWAATMGQFPGTGREYPLAPGEAAVIAEDGLDHSQFDPAYPDLSHADFEIVGTKDADNPDVPNIAEVGTRPERGERGVQIHRTGQPNFLALPLDLAALPRQRDPFFSIDWVRIPPDAVLDVMTRSLLDVEVLVPFPYCDVWLPPRFDRLETVERNLRGHPDYPRLSLARRLLAADGSRRTLLNLDASMLDWRIAIRSPGIVP